MPAAFDKDTGALKYVLDKSGKWVAPTIADNPETGERYYLDDNEWKPVPLDDNERGAGRAAATLQGPAMGFGDEFVAGLENPGESLSYLSRFARPGGVAAEVLGKNGPAPAMPGYDASLRKFRDIESRYRQDSPVESFAITGAAGLAGGGAQVGRSAFNATARALPRAGRLGQAAATGAEFGAVGGFGSGEDGAANRLVSSVFGAGIGAAAGGALEAAAPAVATLYRMARGNPRMFDPRAGRLTPEGEAAAREAGLDPAQASAALQREFAAEAQNALRPGEAAAVAEARSLPSPVQLRRGQTTLDPDQQMFESQAGKGVYGQLAQEAIRGSDEAQQAALRGNVPAIQGRIGGGQVQEAGQGVATAQNALATAEQTSRRSYGGLYDAARGANDQASVPGAQVSQGTFDIGQSLARDGFTRRSAPAVHEVLDEIQSLARASQQRPSTSVAEIWARRQELNALARGTPTPQTTAAGNARRALDRWLGDLIDNGLIEGNPRVVEMWRQADSARRAHGQRFEAGDFVEKLTARHPDGRNELALDPQAAVNLIFGRSETGFTSQSGMVRGLVRLRAELGANSAAWNGIREEAFLRFARAGEGATTPTGRDFSGANFAKAWEAALAKTPGTMRLLFNEEERNLISQFARVARRTTTNVRGGNNTSNTSAGVAQAVRRLWTSAFMGPRMAAFLESVPIVRGLSNIGQELRATRAVQNRLQRGYRPVRAVNQAVERSTGSLANSLVQSVLGR